MSPSLPWIIIGFGRVGQAISCMARELDATVLATWNRTPEAARAASVPSPDPRCGPLPGALSDLFDGSSSDKPVLLWLTVVDDAIRSVFVQLADHLPPGSLVIHTSGSLSSELLAGHPHLSVASLHPLQAITDPVAAVERFPRTFWTVEGDDIAVDYIEELLAPIKIEPVRIDPDDKVLYHASAVCAANLLVSLFDAAISMAEAANIDPDRAREMLVDLGRSSLDNLSQHPPPQALSGPVARGDMATIEDHRRALKGRASEDPQLLEIYDLLTRRAISRLT